MTQANTPLPSRINIPGNYLQNLNDYLLEREPNHKPFDYETIRAFNTALEDPTNISNKVLTESTHAELTVASYFAKKQSGGVVPIGVSKRACFLCYKYLNSLSHNRGLRFVGSGYHRKVPATWRAPPADMNSDLIAEEAEVGAAVDDALDDLIARIARRRNSDSPGLELSIEEKELLKLYQDLYGGDVFDE